MKQLPEDFQALMRSNLSEEETAKLIEAIDSPTPTSIRINRSKASEAELEEMLRESEPVKWCEGAYYLTSRPQFTMDPLLHAGCYYVQEASSMYIGAILRHLSIALEEVQSGRPLTVLDACAAPGGKSTLALASLPEGTLLVANEYVRQRSNILAENLIKWGNPNIIVTNSDTQAFTNTPALFDIILCDAPCSGEGMFRKDDKAIEDWSLDNVNLCQHRQREILTNLWQALRPGGFLIYSTCTFNHLEDEDNAQWIEETLHGTAISLDNTQEQLADSAPNIKNGHFFPHLTKGEGFYVSVFQKGEEEIEENFSRKKKKDQKGKAKTNKIPKELALWVEESDRFLITETQEGCYTAFPKCHETALLRIQEAMRVVHSGIELATTKGKNLQPAHSLAMSNSLNRKVFPFAELSYEQAIAYLRTESITLPSDIPTGYVLVTYRQHPLGFVKNIGNRANNLYPQEWKIKKQML